MKLQDFKVGFPLASVWFGALVGPSLLTGVFGTVYFAPYGGAWSMLIMLASVLVAVTLIVFASEVTKRNQAYHFGAMSKAMYGKWDPILGTILNIYMLVSVLVGAGTVIATTSSLLQDLLGVSPLLGSVMMAALCTFLAAFGAKFVRAISSVMSVILIVGMALLVGIIVYFNHGSWGQILTSWVPADGYKVSAGFYGAVVLALYQSSFAMHLCSVEQTLKTKGHTIAFAISCVVLLFIAFCASTLMVLPYIPEVLPENIPLISIIQNHFGKLSAIGTVLYTVTMFFALVSSAVPIMQSCIARVDGWYPRKGLLNSVICRNVITGILFWVIALCVSFLGLKGIVSTVYSYLGYAAVPLIVIPCCFVLPIKRSRAKRRAALDSKNN